MKFQIGETVCVVLPGQNYSNWGEMYTKLGFTDPLVGINRLTKGGFFVIFNSTIHPKNSNELYAIRSVNGAEYLVNELAIRHINETDDISSSTATEIKY